MNIGLFNKYELKQLLKYIISRLTNEERHRYEKIIVSTIRKDRNKELMKTLIEITKQVQIKKNVIMITSLSSNQMEKY